MALCSRPVHGASILYVGGQDTSFSRASFSPGVKEYRNDDVQAILRYAPKGVHMAHKWLGPATKRTLCQSCVVLYSQINVIQPLCLSRLAY